MSEIKKNKTEGSFKGKYSAQTFESLWFAYRPYLKTLWSYLILGFLGRIILLSNANILGLWVDSLCRSLGSEICKNSPSLFTTFSSQDFIVLLFSLATLGFIMTWIFRVGFSRVSAFAASQIYDETTYRTSRFPMTFFDNVPAGRVITRFSSDYGNVFRLFGGPLSEFLSIVFDMIAMVVLIGLASPFYLPLILAIGFINFLIYKFNQEKLRQARRALSASRSPSVAHFAETTQGASTIRSFNKQQSFMDRFKSFDNFFLANKKQTVKNIMFFSFQMNLSTAFLLMLTGLFAYFLLQRGLVTVGSVGVAFGFITLSGNTIQMFFEWFAQFEEAMIGVERLDDYIRKDIEPGNRLPAEKKFPTTHWTYTDQEQDNLTLLPIKVSSGVEFKDVWFRYAENLPWVLKGLSFQIRPGEKFGIIGRTGSGKSSLIQTLFYLYPIEKGSISINGLSPKLNPEDSSDQSMDLAHYRKHIAFISQDPILFSGRLKENLLIEPHFSDAVIFQALNKVGLSEWANPQGLEIPIEENGRNLSLGEKQLICMARCLLQNSPIVIMDEATSSVDPKSEEILMKATQEFFQDKTQIIIAHRLSTLEHCDRILWLQDGQIQMIGQPKEVLPLFEKTNLTQSNSMVTNTHDF